MGYTFTFGDIERICKSLNMEPIKPGSRFWAGYDSEGRYRSTQIHSHGSGKPLATGTARAVARQLLFRDLVDMYRYLQEL